MCSLDELVVWAIVDRELNTEAESFELWVGGVAKEHGGVDLGIADEVFFACLRCCKLQSTKETSCTDV